MTVAETAPNWSQRFAYLIWPCLGIIVLAGVTQRFGGAILLSPAVLEIAMLGQALLAERRSVREEMLLAVGIVSQILAVIAMFYGGFALYYTPWFWTACLLLGAVGLLPWIAARTLRISFSAGLYGAAISLCTIYAFAIGSAAHCVQPPNLFVGLGGAIVIIIYAFPIITPLVFSTGIAAAVTRPTFFSDSRRAGVLALVLAVIGGGTAFIVTPYAGRCTGP